MAFGDVDIKLDILGTYLGENTFTRLQYFGDTVTTSTPDAEQFATDWLAACLTPLQGFLSTQFFINRVDCQINQIGAFNSPTNMEFINQAGTVVDNDPSASFVTQVIIKQPDNALITPAGQPVFRNGALRFAGVPGDAVSSGELTVAHRLLMDAFATAALTITSDIGNGSENFQAGMARSANTLVGGNPVTKVPLVGMQSQKVVSTQSTRKYYN